MSPTDVVKKNKTLLMDRTTKDSRFMVVTTSGGVAYLNIYCMTDDSNHHTFCSVL